MSLEDYLEKISNKLKADKKIKLELGRVIKLKNEKISRTFKMV